MIDFSTIPDRELKHLLTYIDHGIKIFQISLLVSKHRMGVAMAMLQSFCCAGPLTMLKIDNSSEFSSTECKWEDVLL